MTQPELETLANSALQLLSANQKQDGGFTSLSSPSADFHESLQYQTTFFTSLILSCLDPAISAHSTIAAKAVEFLVNQKNDHWTFNYWTRQSPEYTSLPYPDDLDDTFCALTTLYRHRPELFTGSVLAKISQALIAAEQKPGGPYRTWLVDQSAGNKWQDVDLAVNSNIGAFLLQQMIELPNLVEFVERKIDGNDLSSPYYPTQWPIIYFISCWYHGPKKQNLIDLLVVQSVTENEHMLNLVLAASALCNFGAAIKDIEPLIDRINRQFRANGFLAHPFCYDPARQGEQHYAGSPELTAAFCVQAINLYQTLLNPGTTIAANQENIADTQMHNSILKSVEQTLAVAGPTIASGGIPFLQAMVAKDVDKQISLLPQQFAVAVAANQSTNPSELIHKLGEANIHGWLAYTIYDQVMDESNQFNLLPVAQVSARAVAGIFNALPVPPPQAAAIKQLFKEVMDGIDEANAWEIAYARKLTADQLPDYGDLGHLARRSQGHALGPLAIIIKSGYGPGTPQFQGIKNFFFHYLIARQLNDDAHDWEDDLARGQLTVVVVWLLCEFGPTLTEPTESVDMSELQKLFWRQTIHKVNQQLEQHIAKARAEAEKSGLFPDNTFVDQLLRPFEQSLKISQQETAKAESFINEYRDGVNLL